MVLTVAELIGTPAWADEFDLDRAIEAVKKATTGGSAIPVGRVASFDGTNWVIGASGSTGRAGVVAKLHPKNTDTSGSVTMVVGKGAEIYVEIGTGPINPGQDVTFDANGKVKVGTSANSIGTYLGHYGEASGAHGNMPTAGLTGDAARIELRGF